MLLLSKATMNLITNFKKISKYVTDVFNNSEIRVVSASLSILSTRFFNFACSLLSGVILARVLQPEGKGEYTIFLLFPLTLSRLGSLGLGISITHFSSKDPSTRHPLNANSIIFTLLLSVFYTFLLFLLYEFKLLEHFGDFEIKHIVLIAVVLPPLLFRAYSQSLLHGTNYISAMNILVSSESGIYLLFLIILASIGFLNVWFALCSWVVTIVTINVLTIILLFKFNLFSLKSEMKLLIQCIKMGLKYFTTELAGFIILQSDLLLIHYFVGNRATGIYSLAASLSFILISIPQSVGLALFPHISRIEHLAGIDGTGKTIRYCRFTLIITITASVMSMILAPFLLEFFYGSSFSEALYPFLILAVAISVGGFTYVLDAQLCARGIMWVAAVCSIVASIINFSINLILIPKYSFYGAAISSLIAYSSYGLMLSYAYCSIVQQPLKALLPTLGDVILLFRLSKNMMNPNPQT